jgi:hypothetical protein
MRRFRTSCQPFVSLGVMAVCATLSLPALLPAQPTERERIIKELEFAVGTQSLRWLLKKADFEPLTDASQLEIDPDQTVLIVLGDLSWLDDKAPGGVVSFVERGGALLAASDLESKVAGLQDLANVRVTGLHVEWDMYHKMHESDKEIHHGQSDRPFVFADEAMLPDGTANPFNGLRVATNIPSFLRLNGRLPAKVVSLARFPLNSYYEGGRPGAAWRRELVSKPFAVGGERGDGRFLILADHSVFINEMMLAPDCDNLGFAVRCLEWLKADGKRKRAMLVEDGRIHQNFDVAERQLPPISPLKVLGALIERRDEIAEEVQDRFAEAEKKDKINSAILGALRGRTRQGFARLSRYAFWAVGGCLAVLALYRMSNESRYLADQRLPLLRQTVAGQRPTSSVIEQRQQAQVEAGNLWESAREIARQRLMMATGSERLSDAADNPSASWWQRRTARARLRRIWNIAYGATPVRIKPARWERFLADLDAIQKDVANGTVKLPAV